MYSSSSSPSQLSYFSIIRLLIIFSYFEEKIVRHRSTAQPNKMEVRIPTANSWGYVFQHTLMWTLDLLMGYILKWQRPFLEIMIIAFNHEIIDDQDSSTDVINCDERTGGAVYLRSCVFYMATSINHMPYSFCEYLCIFWVLPSIICQSSGKPSSTKTDVFLHIV